MRAAESVVSGPVEASVEDEVVVRVFVALGELPPVRRALVAGALGAAGPRFAVVRRAAIYEATRVQGVTHDDVARPLGVSSYAINKAITAHRRTLNAEQSTQSETDAAGAQSVAPPGSPKTESDMSERKITHVKARRALDAIIGLLECNDLPADRRVALEDGAHAARAIWEQLVPPPEPDRYWTIWTADRRELIGQVSGPGLVDADAALGEATTKPYDFEHTKANSYLEETDETGFNILNDWDSLSEDEKADLRPAVTS